MLHRDQDYPIIFEGWLRIEETHADPRGQAETSWIATFASKQSIRLPQSKMGHSVKYFLNDVMKSIRCVKTTLFYMRDYLNSLSLSFYRSLYLLCSSVCFYHKVEYDAKWTERPCSAFR